MNDKELILNILDHIKVKNGFTDIRSYLIDTDDQTLIRIKLKLEDANLATHHIYDAWSFMATSYGFKLKPSDLRDDGTLLIKKRDDNLWRSIKISLISTSIGAILGASIGLIPKIFQSQPAAIALPSIQIAHDTIEMIRYDTVYMPDSLLKKR